ncbi:uncharacterized protein DFL_000045 [Arthrobotrys flagrans]|uniref:F-box domain-containing protein n=1 Tax=Arthrobotrys flagrans TaxID=97331 RepID=A0A437AD36_ARTFL|nr:hypothetical protein DFL_000045 [Arthrobotrys flagrans]
MEDIQVIDPTGRHERPILTVVTDKLPGPPLNILNLPHELQICILSHLPIAGQIFAGMVCRLWEDIIVNSRSFTKARYHGPDENGYQNRHKLLTHPGGLLCLVQSGRVEGYCFPLDGDDVDFPIDYTNYNSKILTAPRLDIAKCKLLDEPMSSPFVEETWDIQPQQKVSTSFATEDHD